MNKRSNSITLANSIRYPVINTGSNDIRFPKMPEQEANKMARCNCKKACFIAKRIELKFSFLQPTILELFIPLRPSSYWVDQTK